MKFHQIISRSSCNMLDKYENMKLDYVTIALRVFLVLRQIIINLQWNQIKDVEMEYE